MPKYSSEPDSATLAPSPHLRVVTRRIFVRGDNFLSQGHGRGSEAAWVFFYVQTRHPAMLDPRQVHCTVVSNDSKLSIVQYTLVQKVEGF